MWAGVASPAGPGRERAASRARLAYTHPIERWGGNGRAIRPRPPFAPPEDKQTDFERYYIESKPIGRLSVRKV